MSSKILSSEHRFNLHPEETNEIMSIKSWKPKLNSVSSHDGVRTFYQLFWDITQCNQEWPLIVKVILRESISAENIKSGQNVIQLCKCLKCKQKMMHILTAVVKRIMDSYRQILMFSKINFQATKTDTKGFY